MSRKRERDSRGSAKGRLLVVIQAFVSILFGLMLIKVDLLPIKFLIPIILVLLVMIRVAHNSQRRRNTATFFGKIFSIIVIILLAAGSFYLKIVNDAFGKITEENESSVAFDVTEDTFHVYLSGIDIYGEIGDNSRSDVNIIATVNPKSHQILLTTTPRDAYVSIPGVSDGQKDKLTHAGIYGVQVSVATLENVYETTIPFYARVNFNSIIEIVDELGGVDVYSEYAFTTKDGYEVKEGANHFNGEEALSFCRERKNVPGGDNQRGKNQQAVIVAMIKKVLSPQMLFSASRILECIGENVETNLSRDQIQMLIKMQIKEGCEWSICSVAATGSSVLDYTYSMPNTKLYVTKLDEDSILSIIGLMQQVENGEILEDSVVVK